METKNYFENYLLLLAILILPLLVLPVFANAFITPKLALITFTIGIVLLIKSARNIMRNSLNFSASLLDLPVLLLGSAYVASSILQTPNKMEAYFLPGNATIILSCVLIFFLTNQMPKKIKMLVRYFLFISGAVASILVLFATTGVFKSISSLPAYIQSSEFTTLGGPLPALIFLATLLPVGISLVVREKEMVQRAFFGVALVLVILALLVCLFNVLPGRPSSPQHPGFKTSWYVAVDSLKQSPLFGAGPGNYQTAFNRFRPIEYNTSPLWNARFVSAQNYLFTAVTETGLAGVAALAILVYFAAKLIRERSRILSKDLFSAEYSILLSLLTLGTALLIFPPTPTLLIVFFILLALAAPTTRINLGIFNQHSQNAPFAARLPVIVATLPMIVGVIIFGFQATRALAADISYKKALDLAVQDDGRGAYDTLQKAINTNPYVDRYRITYAQINLALANSIARKEEISEEDRKTIAQLIQQAIREGKAAVALNPTRAGNWEVLASIYRAVMPLAQGADAFAVQTYAQAISLDPLNVNTRIALGGIYYAAKAYDDAIDVFRLAVAAKPDHANAHYNLAIAYRDSGDLDRAIAEMGRVLSLVDKNSNDFTVASQVLEDLQNKKKAETPESENLTPPAEVEQSLEPPLDLPEGSEPPEPQATPGPDSAEEGENAGATKDEVEASPTPTL